MFLKRNRSPEYFRPTQRSHTFIRVDVTSIQLALDSITMPTSPRRSKRRFSSTSIGSATWTPQLSMVTSATRGHEDPPVQPLTYASLPPTPILPSPPVSSLPPSERGPTSDPPSHQPLFSLWDYLREELLATDFDSHQELKWERVSNFLNIPVAIEKVSVGLFREHDTCLTPDCQIVGFGFLLCLDSFLYTFTIQPIRFFIAASRSIYNLVTWSKSHLPPSQKADILRTLLVVVSIALLIPLADASKIYHSIRGQDTIKLYVIFNSLEVSTVRSLIRYSPTPGYVDCRQAVCVDRTRYT